MGCVIFAGTIAWSLVILNSTTLETGLEMRLWIDDLRVMPTDYTGNDDWAQTSIQAINFLQARQEMGIVYDEISFDHDLGYLNHHQGDETTDDTLPVMDWMVEHDYWPKVIVIHTQNPVGRDALRRTADRYAPEGVEIYIKTW